SSRPAAIRPSSMILRQTQLVGEIAKETRSLTAARSRSVTYETNGVTSRLLNRLAFRSSKLVEFVALWLVPAKRSTAFARSLNRVLFGSALGESQAWASAYAYRVW